MSGGVNTDFFLYKYRIRTLNFEQRYVHIQSTCSDTVEGYFPLTESMKKGVK